MFQSIRNYFSSIFSSSPFAATPVSAQEAVPAALQPQPLPKEPEFLLPKTAEEYRHRLTALEQERLTLLAELAGLEIARKLRDLTEELRKKEWEEILSHGETIVETRDELSPSTSPRWVRRARRIVRYGGQFHLMVLDRNIRWKKTGEKGFLRLGHTEFTKNAPVYEGEEGEPNVLFVTNSVSQMTDWELWVIKTHS